MVAEVKGFQMCFLSVVSVFLGKPKIQKYKYLRRFRLHAIFERHICIVSL